MEAVSALLQRKLQCPLFCDVILKCQTNNPMAGDLRHHDDHCDVTVMNVAFKNDPFPRCIEINREIAPCNVFHSCVFLNVKCVVCLTMSSFIFYWIYSRSRRLFKSQYITIIRKSKPAFYHLFKSPICPNQLIPRFRLIRSALNCRHIWVNTGIHMCHDKFIQMEQKLIYIFFKFLHIDMTYIVEIFHRLRPGHTYSI